MSAFHRAGQCPVPRRGEASVSFKVSGRGKRWHGLGNVKVLIELLQKFAGFLGAEPLSRLSQQAKLLIVQRAQEDTQKKQISRKLHLGTHAMGGVPNAS